MSIRLNGEPHEVPERTVGALVRRLVGDARLVAVEHNGGILPRDRYEETRLGADDRVEIVRFVQGG